MNNELHSPVTSRPQMFFLIHVNSLLSQNLLACDNPTNLNTEKEHVNTLAKIILFHKHGFP